jgi:hypothetical protein
MIFNTNIDELKITDIKDVYDYISDDTYRFSKGLMEPIYNQFFVVYYEPKNDSDIEIAKYVSYLTCGYKLNNNKIELYLNANHSCNSYNQEIKLKDVLRFLSTLEYKVLIFIHDKRSYIVDTFNLIPKKFDFEFAQNYNNDDIVRTFTIKLEIKINL